VEYGATVNRLLAAMHDRASVNGVAMKTITSSIYTQMWRSVLQVYVDEIGVVFPTSSQNSEDVMTV